MSNKELVETLTDNTRDSLRILDIATRYEAPLSADDYATLAKQSRACSTAAVELERRFNSNMRHEK